MDDLKFLKFDIMDDLTLRAKTDNLTPRRLTGQFDTKTSSNRYLGRYLITETSQELIFLGYLIGVQFRKGWFKVEIVLETDPNSSPNCPQFI